MGDQPFRSPDPTPFALLRGRTLTNASSSFSTADPWEWMVLGFSVAMFAALLVIAFFRFCLYPKSRPPKVITSRHANGTDGQGTGSICSDVTSHGLPAIHTRASHPSKRHGYVEEKKDDDEVPSSKDDADDLETSSKSCASHLMHLSEREDEDEYYENDDIWDYSVKSFTDKSNAESSVDGMTSNSHGSAPLMQESSSASTSSSYVSPKYKCGVLLPCDTDTDERNTDSTSNLSGISPAATNSTIGTTSTMATTKRRGGVLPYKLSRQGRRQKTRAEF